MSKHFQSTFVLSAIIVAIFAPCCAIAQSLNDDYQSKNSEKSPPAAVPDLSPKFDKITNQPLQGHVSQHSLGVRSLPAGRQPDYIIGHFAVGLPFLNLYVNYPPSSCVTMASKCVKKWQGKQVSPCVLKLTKLHDDSDGYFFKTLTDNEGPSGWLMPMPKVSGKDRVIPWAIYFDQESKQPQE